MNVTCGHAELANEKAHGYEKREREIDDLCDRPRKNHNFESYAVVFNLVIQFIRCDDVVYCQERFLLVPEKWSRS